MKCNKYLAFMASALTILLFGMVMYSIGALLPSISEQLELSPEKQGVFTMVLPFGVLIGSLLFGPVCDSSGYKMPLLVSTFLVLAGMFCLGMASSFAIVSAGVFMAAIGGGAINGITMAVVTQAFDKNRAAMLTILGVFYGIGAVSMPFLVSQLESSYSVNAIVLGTAAAVAVPLLFVALIKFPAAPEGEPMRAGDYFSLFKIKPLLALSAVLFFASAAEGVSGNWTPQYFIEAKELDKSVAVAALMALPIAMSVTRLVAGLVLSKKTENIIYYITLVIALCGTLMLFFLKGEIMAVVACALLGAGLSQLPILIGKVSETSKRFSSTAISIALTFALTGSTIMNFLTGLTAEKMSIAGMPFILLVIVLGLFITFTIAVGVIRKSSKASK